ncbi:MAG: Potassium efflux system KefA protein / Small-conductance mechanosensitive channel [Candidatus Saccharibacteria bacterium]|nr:Potassium efflux system KefA protein / Small-conductance mechanosensitive channel [Candidatus Saccharibacteria bacterium]
MGGLDANLTHVGHLLSDWADKHLFNVIVIVLGAYVLRTFGSTVINGLIRQTIRGDMFPTELDRKKRIKTLSSLVNATVRVVVWLVATIMIVGELGINTAPLLASAGVLGVALGFGAQSLIKDFVSGIFIITENQYRVGDIVQLGNVSGVVESITIRTTVLRDLDGYVHHVPNGTIQLTTNKTSGYTSLNEDLTVPVETDLVQLEHIINHVGQELAAKPELAHKIKQAPKLVSIKGYSNDGITVKIIGQTSPSNQYKVRSEFYRLLNKSLATHKIEAKLSSHSLDL